MTRNKEIPPYLKLFRLCDDDESAAEGLLAFITKHTLIEIDLPEEADYPADHKGDTPLPLPQWRRFLREKAGATVRAYVHAARGESRAVLVIRMKGKLWHSDATEFLSALGKLTARTPGPAPEADVLDPAGVAGP